MKNHRNSSTAISQISNSCTLDPYLQTVLYIYLSLFLVIFLHIQIQGTPSKINLSQFSTYESSY